MTDHTTEADASAADQSVEIIPSNANANKHNLDLGNKDDKGNSNTFLRFCISNTGLLLLLLVMVILLVNFLLGQPADTDSVMMTADQLSSKAPKTKSSKGGGGGGGGCEGGWLLNTDYCEGPSASNPNPNGMVKFNTCPTDAAEDQIIGEYIPFGTFTWDILFLSLGGVTNDTPTSFDFSLSAIPGSTYTITTREAGAQVAVLGGATFDTTLCASN